MTWTTPKEAAAACGVHPRTLKAWLAAGRVQARRLAGGRRAPWRVALVDGLTVPAEPPGRPARRRPRQ